MRKLFCTLLMLLYSMNGFATDCKVNDPDIVGTYTGGCKNGLAHGKGVAQGRDKYEGMFKNGNLHGQGTYSWSSGNRYEGQWQDGKKHGNGTVTWANGERYEGQWQDGKKHGNGTYTWPSGGRFVGMYKNGKRHGHGILYQPKISLVQSAGYTEGEWEDDRKVSGEFVAYRDSSSSTTSTSSSRSGEFNIHPNQPERHSYYTSWGAGCASGGYAFVNVNDDSRNVYCRGGSDTPGGCDVGIGVEAALAKACRGE